MPYNLNNCFPKSYTEYYQNQQQQQQQQQQKQQQFTSKFAINNIANATHAQMLNAIEHDYNAFNAGVAPVTERNTKATNPFLAVSNFKKFNQPGTVEGSVMEGYNTTSMKRIGKRKTFVDKLEDKRFYSLKFSGGGKNKTQNPKTISNGGDSSSRTGVVGVLGPLIIDGNNKCKRHHSFAGGSVGDIDPKGLSRNPLHFYDTPAYENVNDAVQVHNSNTNTSDMEMQAPALSSSMGTATVLLHPLPHHTIHLNGGLGASSTTGPKKKHHQRQHQPKEDLNLIEPERLSIYRSDSGISNSSYECVTPVPPHGTARCTPPPGKTPRTPKTPKTPKTHKTNSLVHSTVTANFNSAHKKQAPRVPPTPLYINVNNDSTATPISNLERPSSPNSAVATSAYESASSSQNDGTCADPASLSSCTSLYSGKPTSISRCSRHQQPPEISTPEEYEQYQLGHHPHGHSSSSLSVASSVSGTGANGSAWSKCKKQQKSAATSNVTSLETISDPYAHIKHISDCREQHLRFSTVAVNNQNRPGGNNETYNYCPESTNAFKATTAAASVNKSKQQQQVNLQSYNAIDNAKQNELHKSHHRHHHHHHQHYYEQFRQQQQQQQQQLGFTHSQHTQQMLMSSTGNTDDIDDDVNNDRPYNDPKYSPRTCYLSYAHDDNGNDNDSEEMGETAENLRIPQMTLTTDRKLPATTNTKTTYTTTTTTTATTTTREFEARPVKLPLRKYHSFHFQTSQTVAGQQQCKLKKLKMQQQEQLQFQAHAVKHPEKHSYGKEGPLVFLPLCLNENSTFKPIVPTEESEEEEEEEEEEDDPTEMSINDELEQYSKSTLNTKLIKSTSSMDTKNCELNTQNPVNEKSFMKFSKISTNRKIYNQINETEEKITTAINPIIENENLLLSRINDNSSPITTSTTNTKIENFSDIKRNDKNNDDEIFITSKTLIRSPQIIKLNTKNIYIQNEEKATELSKKEIFENKSKQITWETPSQIINYDKLKKLQKHNFNSDTEYCKESEAVGNSSKLFSSNIPLSKSMSFINDSDRFEKNDHKFETETFIKSNDFLKTKQLNDEIKLEKKNSSISAQFFQSLNQNNIKRSLETSKYIDMNKVMLEPLPLVSMESQNVNHFVSPLKRITSECCSDERSIGGSQDNTFSTRNIKSPSTSLETLELLTKSNPELWYNTQAGSRQTLHQLQLFHSLQNLKNSHKPKSNTRTDVIDKEKEEEKGEEKEEEEEEEKNDNDEDLGYTFYEDENDNDVDVNDNYNDKQIIDEEPTTSPNVTVIMADNANENQVRYNLTKPTITTTTTSTTTIRTTATRHEFNI
uniref:Uncharacterized protein n=1 Tax=Glossina brevipalpis TaxID=37001 RepID=A0A1A9WU56_9MUSC